MLNVHSQSAALLIWLAIGLIVFIAGWSLFSIPPVNVLWDQFTQSRFMTWVQEMQVLTGLLIGFLIVSAALLANGWRGRKKERDDDKDNVQRLAQALTIELEDFSADCRAKAVESWALSKRMDKAQANGDGAHLFVAKERFRAIASPQDTLLMRLSPDELLLLGTNVYGAVRRLRQDIRCLGQVIDGTSFADFVNSKDQADYFKELAHSYLNISLSCDRMRPFYDSVARSGVQALEMVGVPALATQEEIEKAFVNLTGARGNTKRNGTRRAITKSS